MTGANQQYTQTISLNTNNIQNVLSNYELELYELTKITGIIIDPQIFRVLVELLKMDVSPAAIFSVLQNMAYQASETTSMAKKNIQNKSDASPLSGKKKPPVAAKPKKVKVNSC